MAANAEQLQVIDTLPWAKLFLLFCRKSNWFLLRAACVFWFCLLRALTGLPEAAFKPAAPLAISVVIILLSGGDNLKCTRLSRMQGRQQKLSTYLIFYIAFAVTENGTAMNFHSVPPAPHLAFVRQHKACQVTSIQPVSRTLCKLASNVIPDSMKTKPESFQCTKWSFQLNYWEDSTWKGNQWKSQCNLQYLFQTLLAKPLFPHP